MYPQVVLHPWVVMDHRVVLHPWVVMDPRVVLHPWVVMDHRVVKTFGLLCTFGSSGYHAPSGCHALPGALRYVYTLRLIGPISYLGACYIRTTVTKWAFVRKWRYTFVGEPLNHIHQDTKSARLIAVCKRSLTYQYSSSKGVHILQKKPTKLDTLNCCLKTRWKTKTTILLP